MQPGYWTVHTQLIFLHDQKIFEVHFQDSIGHCCAAPFCAVAPAPRPASASPAPRGGPPAPSQPCISESERQRSHSAARETRQCIVVTSLQLLDLASQSVQLDDVCLQAVPLLLHELNCSCHRNSCAELTFLSSKSCKSCLRSRRR